MRRICLFAIALFCLSSCANQDFRAIASNVLGSSGLVSSSQADAFFSAGEQIVAASTPLTEEQEYYLGRGVAASILGRYRPLQNEGTQRYVNRVGRVVAAVSDRPDTFRGYRFLVLDTEDVNAMAAPSGFIFISRGLFRVLRDEDELAAVLAHEVAHIVFSHGVNAVSQSKYTKALSILGREAAAEYTPAGLSEVTDLFGDSVTEISETLLTSGYSRSQEYKADEYAATLLMRAGYDPRALGRVLSHLEKVSSEVQKKGGWFETHPSPADRRDSLDEDRSGATLFERGYKARTARFMTVAQGVR